MEPNEIYRSLIRLHILIEAAKAPIEGESIAGLNRDKARRILREFESKGYLATNGRVAGVYAITKAGRLRARDAKKKIAALMEIFDRGEFNK